MVLNFKKSLFDKICLNLHHRNQFTSLLNNRVTHVLKNTLHHTNHKRTVVAHIFSPMGLWPSWFKCLSLLHVVSTAISISVSFPPFSKAQYKYSRYTEREYGKRVSGQ